MKSKLEAGCELCNDFPALLLPKCHPTAPLRIELVDPTTLVIYCYLPNCNREVAKLKLQPMEN